MDLSTIFEFVEQFVNSGYVRLIADDPRIQFGEMGRELLFPRWLPDEIKDTNVIVEDLIRFGQIIADDGEELSPPQIKQAPASGLPMTTTLGHIDIATQMDGADMKVLGNLLMGNDVSPAEEFFSEWLTRNIRQALDNKEEKQRVEALVDAQVTIQNKDNDELVIPLPNPTGHRVTVPSGTVAAPAGWYSDAYDPIVENILPIKLLLASKGYMITNIIYSTQLENVLLSNQKMRERGGAQVIYLDSGTGTIRSTAGILNETQLASIFRANGLPAPIKYDLLYGDHNGSYPFLDPTKMLFICATNRNTFIEYDTEEGLKREIVRDVLGYYGVGVVPGHFAGGRSITLETRRKKPIGIYAEGLLQGFPVIKMPEAIACITVPEPTP